MLCSTIGNRLANTVDNAERQLCLLLGLGVSCSLASSPADCRPAVLELERAQLA